MKLDIKETLTRSENSRVEVQNWSGYGDYAKHEDFNMLGKQEFTKYLEIERNTTKGK